jgi:hypothetical protein
LSKNNLESFIQVELLNYDQSEFHKSLGRGYAKVKDLAAGAASIVTPAGKVNFKRFSSMQILSLIDLISQGMQMSLYVAIDFTGSNGLPTQLSSLHYMNPNGAYNGYENAILSVGSILQEYDSQKNFPVFGFGATFSKAGITSVSHCFPVSGNGANPFVVGVPGIIGAYRQSLPFLSFSGPTYFAPIIQ